MTTDAPAGAREIRILALDVGEKRIGLAVSDPLGITAQGLGVLLRKDWESDLARLTELARALATALGVQFLTWDERLTTVEAERVLLQADVSRRRRRQVVDQLAAVLILQGYLEQRQQPRP